MFKFFKIKKGIQNFLMVQKSQHDFLMRAQWAQSLSAAKNPLNRFGAKYFSQADEDGIALEIVKRLGIKAGTLNPQRFTFFKAWVSMENVARLMQQGFKNIATNELDVLSLDLDGNDYYFAQELLKDDVLPKLFILEYNSKFPPLIKWTIKYDENHLWDGTDYVGASLALFSELLTEYSYTLVCCNAATGANAFFVRNEYLSHFPDVPKDIDDIFVECRYQLYQRWGPSPSSKASCVMSAHLARPVGDLEMLDAGIAMLVAPAAIRPAVVRDASPASAL